MFAVVVSENAKSVAETAQTSSKVAQSCVSNKLDVIEVRKCCLEILEELLFSLWDLSSRKYSLQVGEVMVCVETVPVNVLVVDQSACDEMLSKSIVRDSTLLELIKLDS